MRTDNTFLISPNFVRHKTNISTNTLDHFLESAIREAQDINYTELVGTRLVDKLIDIVNYLCSDICTEEERREYERENEVFIDLMEISKYYLAYMVVARVTVIAGIKIDNIGPSQTYDDNVRALEMKEIFHLEKHYIHIADTYAAKIQRYIHEHFSELREYLHGTCYEQHANLKSSASTSLWLGGARGKHICGAHKFRHNN